MNIILEDGCPKLHLYTPYSMSRSTLATPLQIHLLLRHHAAPAVSCRGLSWFQCTYQFSKADAVCFSFFSARLPLIFLMVLGHCVFALLFTIVRLSLHYESPAAKAVTPIASIMHMIKLIVKLNQINVCIYGRFAMLFLTFISRAPLLRYDRTDIPRTHDVEESCPQHHTNG
jgi:hypothetical protein